MQIFKVRDKVRFVTHDNFGYSINCKLILNSVYIVAEVSASKGYIKLYCGEDGREYSWLWLETKSFVLAEKVKPREFAIVNFCRNNYKDFR